MVTEITRYKCRVCSKEYKTNKEAEYCESRIPPKNLPPGTVFMSSGKSGKEYLILEKYKGVREHFAVFLGHRIHRESYPDEAPAAYNVRTDCVIEVTDVFVNNHPDARKLEASDIEKLCKADRKSIEEVLSIINFNK